MEKLKMSALCWDVQNVNNLLSWEAIIHFLNENRTAHIQLYYVRMYNQSSLEEDDLRYQCKYNTLLLIVVHKDKSTF